MEKRFWFLALFAGLLDATLVRMGPCMANGHCYDIHEGNSATVPWRVDLAYINMLYDSPTIVNNDINRVQFWWHGWFVLNGCGHLV